MWKMPESVINAKAEQELPTVQKVENSQSLQKTNSKPVQASESHNKDG